MNEILTGIMSTVGDPITIAVIFAGVFLGLTFGTLPGLTAIMGIALLIPLTYSLTPVAGVGMLIGVYIGGMSGGAISAIMLNIPGTPSAVVTTVDGYPMARKGQAAKAMGWACFASFFGTVFSWLILVLLAPILAKMCTSFSVYEYAALAAFGLTMVSAIGGKDIFKAFLMLGLGMFLSIVGTDPVFGNLRFTFKNIHLMGGLYITPVVIGLFSLPQILQSATEGHGARQMEKIRIREILPSFKDIWAHKIPLIITSIIGTFVGIIPATGQSIACFMSYTQCKRLTKDPTPFGEGNPDGVIASEAANNSVCGGALVPMLTLGIPGDSVTAVLIGGLMIHGLNPGPSLFTENYSFIVGIFTAMLVAAVFMLLINTFGIKFFTKIISAPNSFLVGGVVIVSIIGSYALHKTMFDVGVMLVVGTVSYFLVKAKYPLAPAVLGFVLGTTFESELRRSVRLSGNDWSVFLTRPIAMAFICLAVVIIAYSLFKTIRSYVNEKNAELVEED